MAGEWEFAANTPEAGVMIGRCQKYLLLLSSPQLPMDIEGISGELKSWVGPGLIVIPYILIAVIGLWMFWPSVKDNISVASIGGVGVAYGIIYYLMGVVLLGEAVIFDGVCIGIFVAYSRLMATIMSANESYKIVGDVILLVTHDRMLVWLLLWLVNPTMARGFMMVAIANVTVLSGFVVMLMMLIKEYKKILVGLGIIASGAFVRGFMEGFWTSLTPLQKKEIILGIISMSKMVVIEIVVTAVILLLFLFVPRNKMKMVGRAIMGGD